MRPGPLNLITGIGGLLVGKAGEEGLRLGVTVPTAANPFTTAVHVMGGVPDTRETDLLAPGRLVQEVVALFLSGDSAFGLDAGTGIMAGLRAMGRGVPVGPVRVPIVPEAILFDPLNSGDKAWTDSPNPNLGRLAPEAACDTFAFDTAGAGYGAMTGTLKGGPRRGLCRPALRHHRRRAGCGGRAWVGYLGRDRTSLGHAVGGGRRVRRPWPRRPCCRKTPQARANGWVRRRPSPSSLPTQKLTKAQAHRMAVAAHDGMARALVPSHTPLDGDQVSRSQLARGTWRTR